jgi:hypothetical protein
MENIPFSVNGINYEIRRIPTNPKYEEIVYADSKKRVPNEKGIVRHCGITVSTDPSVMNTHKAISALKRKIEIEGNKF